jgi:DnaD/phage-associated family protein
VFSLEKPKEDNYNSSGYSQIAFTDAYLNGVSNYYKNKKVQKRFYTVIRRSSDGISNYIRRRFYLNVNLSINDWNSIFAVPKSVVDKHLKVVGSTQLKVLLWALRHGGEKIFVSEISSELLIHPADVKDALQYWITVNILAESGFDLENFASNTDSKNNKIENNAEPIHTNTAFPKKVRPLTPIPKPDAKHLIKRIDGCEEIGFLMKEAELILNKPLSRGESASILALHDNDGLPVDVIVMLLQYAAGMGKRNMRYIEKIGISWAEEGIENIEMAEAKIKSLDSANNASRRLYEVVGCQNRKLTSVEEEAANRWFNIWSFGNDMVKEAYERCINFNGKYILKYMDSIIKRWHSQGIHSFEHLKIESNLRTEKNKSHTRKERKVSYDIDDYKSYCNSVISGKND